MAPYTTVNLWRNGSVHYSILAWLQYISMPEWLRRLQYISVPEWLRRLQYISVPEWLIDYSISIACQTTVMPEFSVDD